MLNAHVITFETNDRHRHIATCTCGRWRSPPHTTHERAVVHSMVHRTIEMLAERFP